MFNYSQLKKYVAAAAAMVISLSKCFTAPLSHVKCNVNTAGIEKFVRVERPTVFKNQLNIDFDVLREMETSMGDTIVNAIPTSLTFGDVGKTKAYQVPFKDLMYNRSMTVHTQHQAWDGELRTKINKYHKQFVVGTSDIYPIGHQLFFAHQKRSGSPYHRAHGFNIFVMVAGEKKMAPSQSRMRLLVSL